MKTSEKLIEIIARMEQELADIKKQLEQEEKNKPKFKVGETVTITSNSDTWEDEIVKITDTHYHFKSGGHLQIDRQDVQLKKQDKLKLKSGIGYCLQGGYSPSHTPNGMEMYIRRGAFRPTKELAEIADRNMVTRNRLEAYVMQLDPEWRENWGKSQQKKYYIYYANEAKKYEYSHVVTINRLGAVYMQKKTAEILCKALNAGEIEL